MVASEVKALANQTEGATGEIRSQITAIQGVSTEAVTAMSTIAGTMQQINEIASAIAAAVEEQGAATQEIAGSVQQAASGTDEVSRNVSAVTDASGLVGESAGQLLNSAGDLSRLGNLRDQLFEPAVLPRELRQRTMLARHSRQAISVGQHLGINELPLELLEAGKFLFEEFSHGKAGGWRREAGGTQNFGFWILDFGLR